MAELLVLRGNFTFFPDLDEQVQIEQTPVEKFIEIFGDYPEKMPTIFHELWRTRRDTDIYQLFSTKKGLDGYAVTMCKPEYLAQRIASIVVSKNVPEITDTEQFSIFLQDLYTIAIKVEENMHLNEVETNYMRRIAGDTAQAIISDANDIAMIHDIINAATSQQS